MNIENKLDGARMNVVDFSKEQWYFRAEIFYAELQDLDELSDSKEVAGKKKAESKTTDMKKKRPVIIVSNNLANKNPFNPNVSVVCVTSSPKKIAKYKRKPSPTQMLIQLDRESLVLCEEIKTIAKARLTSKVGELTSEQIIQLNDRLMKSLGLSWI